MSKTCSGCQSENIYIEQEAFDEEYSVQLYVCESCGGSGTKLDYYEEKS